MGTIGTIVVAVLGSGGLFTFVQYLFTRHDAKQGYATKEELDAAVNDTNRKLDLLKEAALATMQDRLEYVMSRYLRDGEISTNQFKALTHMVEAYKGLGGNSFITEMYEMCKELVG